MVSKWFVALKLSISCLFEIQLDKQLCLIEMVLQGPKICFFLGGGDLNSMLLDMGVNFG